MLKIEPLLERRPRELSGGQRQRVAIGRALVRDPKLFLFDEPLSNLDAALRGDLRAEIKRLHQRIRRTMVYVTHDQIEAMTLATKIVIMNKGVVQQVGTPYEIYYNPVNLFVARFIGSPPITLLQGRADVGSDGLRFIVTGAGSRAELALPKRSWTSSETDEDRPGTTPRKYSHHAVRSARDDCHRGFGRADRPGGHRDTEHLGQPAVIRTPAGIAAQGAQVGIEIDLDRAMLFDPARAHDWPEVSMGQFDEMIGTVCVDQAKPLVRTR